VSPLKLVLWTFRKSPHDVIDLYNTLSPVMQLATGGNMLNFGYWSNGAADPIAAQKSLCSLVAASAELDSAKILVDIGSGLGAPAEHWKAMHEIIDICCLNINREQLVSALKYSKDIGPGTADANAISTVNATSISLPFRNHSADRIIALESAQHFSPLPEFIRECRRVIKPAGILVIAMPVTSSTLGRLDSFFKLGILSLTWSSEHYSLDHVRSVVSDGGFAIKDVIRIGHEVYEPLANYYMLNRPKIRERILQEYPSFLENVLCKSLAKMQRTSRKGIIDYVIIKAS
jgi:cyclopropane fatty-acyl-phospholipid synthase-like methyltransferase